MQTRRTFMNVLPRIAAIVLAMLYFAGNLNLTNASSSALTAKSPALGSERVTIGQSDIVNQADIRRRTLRDQGDLIRAFSQQRRRYGGSRRSIVVSKPSANAAGISITIQAV